MFTLRFDIDSLECATSGLAYLNELSSTTDHKFLFFPNMGRTICRSVLLQEMATSLPFLRKQSAINRDAQKNSVPAYLKISKRKLLHTVLINPILRDYMASSLRNFSQSGHVVGLHGGRNHGLWMRKAQLWDKLRLHSEVVWGMRAIEAVGLPIPTFFASPGWVSPIILPEVLTSLGFECLADTWTLFHDDENMGDELRRLTTSLVAKTRGVGFFEYCYARSMSLDDMWSLVAEEFETQERVILYDHPSFVAGLGRTYFENFCSRLDENSIRSTTQSLERRCAT
jgi:hypothetical protein